MPIPTADFQIDFAGVLLGPGTPYVLSDVAGLGTPELRTQDVELATDDGAFPGVDLYGPRTVTIEAGIRTPGDPAAANEALAALHRAASNPSVRKTAGALDVLRVLWPGRGVRRLYGRVRRVDAITTAQTIYGWIPLTLEFGATDPRWHDDAAQQVTLPLALDGDDEGFTAPVTAPITTGVADPEERPGWITNVGDLPAWPSIKITGPVVNPRIWVVETGRVLELTVGIGAGEYLQIDTRPGTRWVLKNGVSNASADLGAASRLDLFTIPTGTSEIRWTATDYTNTARLAVSWRDAYTAL